MAEQTYTRESKIFNDRLLSLKNSKIFCDATLVANGNRIPIHSVVLAVSCKNFEKIFVDSSSKEKILEDVDLESVQQIIDYIYTGKIIITEKNVEELCELMILFPIPSIIEGCVQILKNKIDTSNCLAIWQKGRKKNIQELKLAVVEFLNVNFEKIYNSHKFFELEYLDIEELLKFKIPQVSEILLYYAVKNWINYDRHSRDEYLTGLLNYIKLTELGSHFLLLESHSLCKSNLLCYKKIIDTLRYEIVENKSEHQTLIAVGSHDERPSTTIEIYDLLIDKWIEIDIGCKSVKFSTVLLGSKLMMIGGKPNGSLVETYDLNTGKKETLKSMQHSRHRTTAVEFNNDVYVIGGYDTKPVSIVEKWDSKTMSWTSVNSLLIPRNGCEAKIWEGKIYVVGGFGGHNNDEFLASVEIYDISTGEWSMGVEMNEKREGPGVSIIGNYLYVVGGWSYFKSYSQTAERFDFNLKKWTLIQFDGLGKYYGAAGCLRGKLIIAGGFEDGWQTTNVKLYDCENQKWVNTTPLQKQRCNFDLVEVPWSLAEGVLSRI